MDMWMFKRALKASRLLLLLLIGLSACTSFRRPAPTVFALGVSNSHLQISALDLNAGKQKYMPDSFMITPTSYDYCPEKQLIVYSAFVEMGEEIVLYNLRGGGGALTSGNNNFRNPVWSPDCSLIAVNSRGEPASIALIQAEGGSTTFIAPPGRREMHGFSWSPAGRFAVTYTRPAGAEQTAPFDLGLLDLTANNLIQQIPGRIDTPFSPVAWSETGDEFIFSANRQGQFDIYQYKVAEREETPLIQTEYDDRYPLRSPDGKNLAFLKASPGGDEFTVNLFDFSTGSISEVSSTPMRINSLLWMTDQELLVTENDPSANETRFYSLNVPKKSLDLIASYTGFYEHPQIIVQD
jgi:Tol biopolymer transport system component